MMLRRVSGDSMLPALRPGRIVVARTGRVVYRTGDVVIFEHAGLQKIKRLAAVRADTFYVRGDNALASTDSRQFGWLKRDNLKGKVIWPLLRQK